MTDLVVQTDRDDVSARFNLNPFVTDWEAARQTFIACVADAFREPLNPRPEDFSTAFPTELGEAWCKYRMFGGSSTIVLRADSIAVTFSNIVRTDYALVSEILRRSRRNPIAQNGEIQRALVPPLDDPARSRSQRPSR